MKTENRDLFFNSYTVFKEIQDEEIFLLGLMMMIPVCVVQLCCTQWGPVCDSYKQN